MPDITVVQSTFFPFNLTFFLLKQFIQEKYLFFWVISSEVLRERN